MEAKDILDGISKIDLGGDPRPAVQFVAENLARLPPVAPEELDLASIVLRLKQLECKSSSLEGLVNKHTEDIQVVMDAQMQMSGYAAATKRQAPQVMGGQAGSRAVKHVSTAPQWVSEVTSQPQQHRSDDAKTPAADHIGGSNGTEQNSINGANDADAEGFERPRE